MIFAVLKAWLMSPLHCVINWKVFYIDIPYIRCKATATLWCIATVITVVLHHYVLCGMLMEIRGSINREAMPRACLQVCRSHVVGMSRWSCPRHDWQIRHQKMPVAVTVAFHRMHCHGHFSINRRHWKPITQGPRRAYTAGFCGIFRLLQWQTKEMLTFWDWSLQLKKETSYWMLLRKIFVLS